jgi:hypothetical protein
MVVAVVMVEHFVLIKEEEVYKEEEEEKICLSVLVAMKGKEEGFG